MQLFYSPRGGRSGSTAVYSLLEYAFYKVYDRALPEINKTPEGKPFFPGEPDIHFSLSHSRTHVLCAIGSSPVGADIESPRIVNSRTAAYFGSPEELALFDPLELWVLKESYIKLIGGTLPQVKQFRFSRDKDKVIPPDPNASSTLYRIENCIAAASIFNAKPQTEPAKIELATLV